MDHDEREKLLVDAVLETAIYGENLLEMREFYGRVMGLCEYSYKPGRCCFFKCARGMLLIFDPRSTGKQQLLVGGNPVPAHGASGPGHMAFSIQHSQLDRWQRHLQQHGVAIESRVRWPEGAESIYFRDPAGNSIELVTPDLWFKPDDDVH